MHKKILMSHALYDVISKNLNIYDDNKWGIHITNIPHEFNIKELVRLLTDRNEKIYLSIILENENKDNSKTNYSSNNITVNFNIKEALDYRNKNDSNLGVPQVILFCAKDKKAVASIDSAYLPVETKKEITDSIFDILISLDPEIERKKVYDLFKKGNFKDNEILDFAESIYPYKDDLLLLKQKETENLYLLNMLPDNNIFNLAEKEINNQIKRNKNIKNIISKLSPPKKKKILKIANKEDSRLDNTTESEKKINCAKNILSYETSVFNSGESSSSTLLKSLSYNDVKDVLELKDLDPKVKPKKRDLIADLILILSKKINRDDLIEDCYEKASKNINTDAEDQKIKLLFEFNNDNTTYRINQRKGSKDLIKTLNEFCNENSYGGIIEAYNSTDYIDCLERREFESFRELKSDINYKSDNVNLNEDGLMSCIDELINRGLSLDNIKDDLTKFINSRKEILPYLNNLCDFPALSLYQNESLLKNCKNLIKLHSNLLNNFLETEIDSPDIKKRLIMLCQLIDIIFIKTEKNTEVIVTPLHPFHLWRWIELVNILKIDSIELERIGFDYFENIIKELPNSNPQILVNHLFHPKYINKTITLEPSESLSSIPIYKDLSSKYIQNVNEELIKEIIQKFLLFSEHPSLGLNLTLIDPPSYGSLLEELSDITSIMEENKNASLYINIHRTRKKIEFLDEDDEIVEEVNEKITRNGGYINDYNDEVNFIDLKKILIKKKSHFIVFFQPGKAGSQKFTINVAADLMPFFTPKTYNYSKTTGEFSSHIHGTSVDFEIHNKISTYIDNSSSHERTSAKSGSLEISEDLNEISKNCMWLMLIEHNHPTELYLNEAEKIDWQYDSKLDYISFISNKYIRTANLLVAQILDQSSLNDNIETIEWLRKNILYLSAEALMSIKLSKNDNRIIDSNEAQGVLGLAKACEWYNNKYPNSLLVSLDEKSTRRWFYRKETFTETRGDLIGIRLGDNQKIIISLIEVKTSKDMAKAKKQIDVTYENINNLFNVDNINNDIPKNILIKARKNCLKDQLFRNLARNRQKGKIEKAKLYEILTDLFQNDRSFIIENKILMIDIQSGLREIEEISQSTTDLNHPVDIINLSVSEKKQSNEDNQKSNINEVKEDYISNVINDDIDLVDEEELVEESNQNNNQIDNEIKTPQPQTIIDNNVQDNFRFYLGDKLAGNDPVYWDPSQNKDNSLKNFGFLVTGDSGSGKTQLLRSLIFEMSKNDFPIMIFDFKNDYAKNDNEDPDSTFLETNNLMPFNIYRRGIPFNILELTPNEDNEVLPKQQIREISLILKRIYKLGDIQHANLQEAVEEAYTNCGIAINDFISFNDIKKNIPEFSDVWNILERKKKDNLECMQRLANINDLMNRGATNRISFDEICKRKVVFHLHDLEDQDKTTIAELTILRFYNYMLKSKQPAKLSRLIVIDEAYRVANSEKLVELARQMRSFGVCLAVGTQYPGDLKTEITAALATNIFLSNSQNAHKKKVTLEICSVNTGSYARDVRSQLDRFKIFDSFVKNDHYVPPVITRIKPYFKRLLEN